MGILSNILVKLGLQKEPAPAAPAAPAPAPHAAPAATGHTISAAPTPAAPAVHTAPASPAPTPMGSNKGEHESAPAPQGPRVSMEHVPAAPPAPAAPTSAAPAPMVSMEHVPASAPAAPAPAPHVEAMAMVDVYSKLEGMAAKLGQPSNWKTSIADLLFLLGMDHSYAARKELAVELHCPEKLMEDSAQMNMWLHKTVLKEIAANGGNIPKELLD